MDVGAGARLPDAVHPVGALLVFGIVPVDGVVHHGLRGGEGEPLGAGVQLPQEHAAGGVILEFLHDAAALPGLHAAVDANEGKTFLPQHRPDHVLDRVHFRQKPGKDDQFLPFIQHQRFQNLAKRVQLRGVHLVALSLIVHQEAARQLLQSQHAHQNVVRGHLAAVFQLGDALLLQRPVQLPGFQIQLHGVILIGLGWQV